ncbi:MAG: DUF1156 domain-containing protein [Candidatus Methanoperedens sp.]|nr:DUF1156 domain-containing protein [Candidatus Methanoperedens sp.]
MADEKRTLIETFLPVEEISDEAKKEKMGTAKPRIFEMHYWWTRKPLVTARAAVLGALLPSNYDISDFKKLLGLGRDERAHNYDINPTQLEKLKQEYFIMWGTETPIILDPFAGGGSIPFEVMRLGANAISNDYNPVAHLIQKATLEYPRKYGDRLYGDVKKGLDWVFEETKKELESYYPMHNGNYPTAYIWAWMVRCPKCGFDTPLVGQWWLVRKEKINIFIQPSVVNGKLHFEIKNGTNAPEGTCEDGDGKCLSCGSKILNDNVRKDIAEREEERLLAVVLTKKGGKEYILPTNEDFDAFNRAKEELIHKWDNWITEDLVPLDEMPGNSGEFIRAKIYLKNWHKILNPRQKILFVTLLKNIKAFGKITSKYNDVDYTKAIMCYLSFILGKSIDHNCRSVTWASTYEVISSAMGKRRPGMMWDHAEVNPFIKGSGSLVGINKSILNGIEYSLDKISNHGNIDIRQTSIATLKLKETVDIIITDPPYFDDVQYAELSEFFYVWERKALQGFYDLGDVPKAEDMSVGGIRDAEFFQKMFKLSCIRMHDFLKGNGILVMFFAHSSVDAWDFVISSLQKAAFRITATWPVHTESTTNPLARGHASMMSSIIIVARKRKSEKSGYIEEIKDEVETHLKKRLDEFWKYGLRGADLTVSAMGATLDVITQYSEIKSYTGEMKIKDVLALVQKYVAEYVLSRYIKNTAGLDAQTSFYLYSRLSALSGMPFDTANLIAKSLNINLKQFESEGLIKSIDKGKAKGIQILRYNERDFINTDPKSLIDAVHLIMAAFEKGGFSEADKQMEKVRYSRNEIKDVLEAFQSLETEDPERQISMKILQRTEQTFPKSGQRGLDDF